MTEQITDFVCRACNATECHWTVNANLKNIHPVMCPSSWPGFCKWGRCALHSSAKSEQEILEEMFKKICKQCPVKEEIHTDDKQCAESCEGCLVRSVYLEDLRSKQGEQR